MEKVKELGNVDAVPPVVIVRAAGNPPTSGGLTGGNLIRSFLQVRPTVRMKTVATGHVADDQRLKAFLGGVGGHVGLACGYRLTPCRPIYEARIFQT